MFDCSELNVMVVGGTSGINQGVALGFAAQGAKVAVASRNQEKVDATVSELQAAGASMALGFSADVRDYDALNSGLEAVAKVLGGFDGGLSC